jgi:hypothetical protein
MSTIGDHWPSDAPRGDRPAMCDYCGVYWPRSQLRKDAEGKWACPDEGDGLTMTELDMENLARMRRPYLDEDEGGRAPVPLTVAEYTETATLHGKTYASDPTDLVTLVDYLNPTFGR